MPAKIHGIDAYRDCIIWQSANTHPGAKTRALIIFTHCQKSNTRRRYTVGSAESYKKAYNSLAKIIDRYYQQQNIKTINQCIQ